jgi:hypothetical protein
MMLYQPFREVHWDDGFSSEYAICDAERSLNILLRLYFMRHNLEASDIYLCSPLTKLGFLSLELLKKNSTADELELSRSTLALVLKSLAGQAQNIYVLRALFKLIKTSIPPADLNIIKQKENSFSENSVEDEIHVEGVIQSAYTPSIISISKSPQSRDLSELAAQSLTALQHH